MTIKTHKAQRPVGWTLIASGLVLGCLALAGCSNYNARAKLSDACDAGNLDACSTLIQADSGFGVMTVVPVR